MEPTHINVYSFNKSILILAKEGQKAFDTYIV